MIAEISSEIEIDQYRVMESYNPDDLYKTAYDDILEKYWKEYKKAGILEKRYADIDEFVLVYQGKSRVNEKSNSNYAGESIRRDGLSLKLFHALKQRCQKKPEKR